MKLLTCIILLNSFIHCELNISDALYKIKHILKSYKSSRCKRCASDTKIGEFVGKTMNLFGRTRNFGEYLKYSNVSECTRKDGEFGESYMNSHILNGLLVNGNVPYTHWLEYKSVHKKEYPTKCHERSALERWRENLHRVAEHNRQFLAGKRSYSLHLNLFGDLDSTDYFNNILKLFETEPVYDPAEDRQRSAYRKQLNTRVPRQVDWRAKGFRPRREQQFQCGACYAFAVTHALQAQRYKKHKDWKELSPQQIVDCSAMDGNSGCEGGSLRAALKYVAREGLVSETHYPYTGKRGRCRFTKLFPRVRPRRWATLPAGDEKAMEKALATIGPLAVAVNAAPFTFQLYKSGIYDDPFCVPWALNHAMLLVGYTPHYWLLLNWWGKDWGEDGYIRIRRGFNRCGVANQATYVEL